MKAVKILTICVAVFSIGAILVSMSPQKKKMPEPWEVSAKYKSMKNPVANDVVSQKKGMAVYKKYCASCHGKKGLGDGVKARGLKTFSGDFSLACYQDQTDGEHFYKTKFGRKEMPKYDKKVSDTDMWNCVNYMRTFKKK